MGLFSSIFGNGVSDAAQKARQDALNAFNAVKTPELSALQVQLQQYVNAGKLTPEEAETQLLTSNAFNNIVTDPSYVGAQKQALQQLQSVASQGGLTAVDKAQLQDVTNQQNQQNRSQNEATMQQAQQRGVGGSDLNVVNQLINEQGAADRASQAGTTVAANAQQRALAAMQAAGQAGGALESQAYGEGANKAQAQNAIDLFNKQALNQTNLYNTQTSNAAQGANLANEQAINNANTGTQNAATQYNAQQNQTVFNDALQKAQGIAAVNQNAANAYQASKDKETGADLGLTSGLLQGGATALGAAFAGPVGATAASGAVPSASTMPTDDQWSTYMKKPGYAEGGEVTDPEHPDHMAMGGHVHCYAHGGKAYHHPECMAEGGEVEASTDTAHIPAAEPEDTKKPERTFIEKLGDLLGSHADIASHVDENQGGKIPEKDFREGGKVDGKAKVEGDSPKNDTVPAMLSPGEIVVPRSAANDEDEFKIFMSKFEPKKKAMAKGGLVPAAIPRVNETNPMRDTAKATMGNPVPLAATNDAGAFAHLMSQGKPKMPKAPAPKTPSVKIPPEARALANLHHRVNRLEGGR